jgi:hypothetical protein
MGDSIPEAIVQLKIEFTRGYSGQNMFYEVIPLSHSDLLPIDSGMLESLRHFAAANPLYCKSYDLEILGVPCRAYEGDITSYWLSSKKHDTSYQPFYPTWMLSAFALARGAKALGFEELVDVGSGDGRVAYCGRLLEMESHGIEIDPDLVQLQKSLIDATGIRYNMVNADATRFDYGTLNLSKPMFFISGLPEMGEMLADSVIRKVKSIGNLENIGFNFMGSHVMKEHTRDRTGWGWGSVIKGHGLELAGTITLPTLWTADQAVDTAYVYTKFRQMRK